MVKLLKMARGQKVKVDKGDYENLSHHSWYIGSHGYAARTIWVKGENRSIVQLLHREIMKAKRGQYVDHVNRDKSDCRRENLRFCSKSTNMVNSKLRKDNKTGFRGIKKHHKKWVARININKQEIHLGMFPTKEDAAKAYDLAAQKHFGEFARLNFP